MIVIIIHQICNFVAPPTFEISGPSTVYEGDKIKLTCQAGPSFPGKIILVKLTCTYTLNQKCIILISDIDLSWQDESIGGEVTRKSEPYLLDSKVYGKIEKISLTVKVNKSESVVC